VPVLKAKTMSGGNALVPRRQHSTGKAEPPPQRHGAEHQGGIVQQLYPERRVV